MFSLFRKKTPPAAESTFKVRVERFWDWYPHEAARISQVIDTGECASLIQEIGAKIKAFGPGFAWVFGSGEGGQGHSFTVSGEGILHRQLLALYWRSRAPRIPGWTFYGSRQPGSDDGIRMNIGELEFKPIEFWITPVVDEEEEQVDITVWHPAFDRVDEQDRMRPVFLFLDEVLGEFGTGQWIGEIEVNNTRLPESMPLTELRGFIANLEATKDWKKKLPPGESATV